MLLLLSSFSAQTGLFGSPVRPLVVRHNISMQMMDGETLDVPGSLSVTHQFKVGDHLFFVDPVADSVEVKENKKLYVSYVESRGQLTLEGSHPTGGIDISMVGDTEWSKATKVDFSINGNEFYANWKQNNAGTQAGKIGFDQLSSTFEIKNTVPDGDIRLTPGATNGKVVIAGPLEADSLYVSGSTTFSGDLTAPITIRRTFDTVALHIRGEIGHTTNLQQWGNDSSPDIAYVTPTGVIGSGGGFISTILSAPSSFQLSLLGNMATGAAAGVGASIGSNTTLTASDAKAVKILNGSEKAFFDLDGGLALRTATSDSELYLGALATASTYSAIYMSLNGAARSGVNYALTSNGSTETFINVPTGGVVGLRVNNVSTLTSTSAQITSAVTHKVPQLFFDRASQVASGIQWYQNSTFNMWAEYMGPAATASQGPRGTLTPPTGTLVTSWGLRSAIENNAGYGWTWESGTSTTTTPSIVAELSSNTGNFRTIGSLTAVNATLSGTLAVTGATTLTGLATLSSGFMNGSYYAEKIFTASFSNGVANQAMDIRLGDVTFLGNIEVEVTSGYSFQQGYGRLTRIFSITQTAGGSGVVAVGRVVEALGPTPDNFAIGDPSWDATNTTYRIPISHIVSTGNIATIRVRLFAGGSGAYAGNVINAMTISSAYTLTALPRQYVNYLDLVGIGTATPNTSAKLEVIGNGILTSASETDAANKNGRYGSRHYTNAEEPFYYLAGVSTSSANDLSIGGGTSLGNAATDIRFYTAANNVTTTGTERMNITSTGVVQVLSGTFALSATSGDNVINIGTSANTNNNYIDFYGSGTYTDYSLRLIRGSGGDNATSSLIHRGTGNLVIQTTDAAAISFVTSGTEKMRLLADGSLRVTSSIDRLAAGALSIGTSTASSVSIGSSGILTTVNGPLQASLGISTDFVGWLSGHLQLIHNDTDWVQVTSGDPGSRFWVGNDGQGGDSVLQVGQHVGTAESRIGIIDTTYQDVASDDAAFMIYRTGTQTIIKHRGAGSFSFTNADAANFIWDAGGTERMRLYATGELQMASGGKMWSQTFDTSGAAALTVGGTNANSVAIGNTSGPLTLTGSTINLSSGTGAVTVHAGATTTSGDVTLHLGQSTNNNSNTYIDLINNQYSDFALRLIRSTGLNGVSQLVHRGTGAMEFYNQESANFNWYVNSAERMRLATDGTLVLWDGSYTAYRGATSTQQVLHNLGWNNSIPRWKFGMESDASFALWSYDSSGGFLASRINVTNGTGVVSIPGSVLSPLYESSTNQQSKAGSTGSFTWTQGSTNLMSLSDLGFALYPPLNATSFNTFRNGLPVYFYYSYWNGSSASTAIGYQLKSEPTSAASNVGDLVWRDGSAAEKMRLTGAGDLFIHAQGSSSGSPRTFGFSNFASGNNTRFQFGDSGTAVQSGFGNRMQVYAYHNLELYGGQGGAVPTFTTGAADGNHIISKSNHLFEGEVRGNKMSRTGFSASNAASTISISTQNAYTTLGSFSYTQDVVSQRIVVMATGSSYTNTGGTIQGVKITYAGVDQTIYPFFFNAANQHMAWSFIWVFTGAATTGSKTVELKITKTSAAAGTINQDNNDHWSFTVL